MRKFDKNNWCIRVTKENRPVLKELLGISEFAWTIGAYYGKDDGKSFGNSEKFTDVLTDEEFKRLVLKQEEIINSYEIY